MDAAKNIISELLDRELRSLCTTCNHRDECTYRQHSGRTIIQCELFAIPPSTMTPGLPYTNADVKQTYRGLCDTCAHKNTCTFFRRNGYVWHCEEFA